MAFLCPCWAIESQLDIVAKLRQQVEGGCKGKQYPAVYRGSTRLEVTLDAESWLLSEYVSAEYLGQLQKK